MTRLRAKTLGLASSALVLLASSSPTVAQRGGSHGGGGFHGGGGWHGGGMHFAHAGFSPRFSHVAFRDGFHHRFFHHRFHRFAFFGAPFAYASYDSCWRRVWTQYGVQVVNVCGDYGY